MKSVFSPLFLAVFAGLTATLSADIEQPKLSKYTRLWQDSLMTVKPDPPEPPERENPLENYVLLSVSPLGGDDYMITMRDTKSKDSKIRLVPGMKDSSGFKILAVEQDPTDYMKTRVKLSSGSREGYVTYDEKQLALKKPPAGNAGNKNTNQRNTGRPPTPNNRGNTPQQNAQNNNSAQPQNNSADLNRILQQGQNQSSSRSNSSNSSNSSERRPRARRVPTPPTR